MSENLPTPEEEHPVGAQHERTAPPSKPDQAHDIRSSKRKSARASDSHKDISSRSPSPLSPEARPRDKDRHRDFRPRKRHRASRRSQSPTDNDNHTRSRSTSPKPKGQRRGFKGGLVALGGLLAAGLPIAGELYLKHMAHEYEREKDERKEVRHEQAMEAKERKKMDLELEAMEEETGYASRKHEIDIRQREVDLQIKEMELDGLIAERKPSGGNVVMERVRDPVSRPDILSIKAPRRRPYRAPIETRAVARDTVYRRDEPRELVPADYWQRRRQPNDVYPNSRALSPGVPREQDIRPPRSAGRERSSSPESQARRRSASPPATPLRAFPTTTALLAGGLTAYKLRDEEGPWLGRKAARIATSAGTAVLTSLTLEKDDKAPLEDDEGLVAHILDSPAFALAGPVMAGIGAERMIWGKKK